METKIRQNKGKFVPKLRQNCPNFVKLKKKWRNWQNWDNYTTKLRENWEKIDIIQ